MRYWTMTKKCPVPSTEHSGIAIPTTPNHNCCCSTCWLFSRSCSLRVRVFSWFLTFFLRFYHRYFTIFSFLSLFEIMGISSGYPANSLILYFPTYGVFLKWIFLQSRLNWISACVSLCLLVLLVCYWNMMWSSVLMACGSPFPLSLSDHF